MYSIRDPSRMYMWVCVTTFCSTPLYRLKILINFMVNVARKKGRPF